MTITAGATGEGNGQVAVSVTANASDAARTGTLTVAGQAVAVLQDALPQCTVDISPGAATYSPAPATGSFAVTAPDHCQWTATSSVSWLVVSGGSPGQGNGTVVYAVDRNREGSSRTGTVAVGARTFTVTQLGETATCEYSVSPVQFDPCMSVPYNLTATVTTQQGCAWTANPDASWITLTEGHSGTGSGIISFRISDNWELPRQGNVMVRWPTPTAGQNLRVSQAGCRYAVTTTAINIPAAGGTGRFDVLQQSDPLGCGGALQDRCLWSAEADVPWITITTSMPVAGDNPVNFTVAANDGTAPRTGRITVRDKTVQVTQAGR